MLAHISGTVDLSVGHTVMLKTCHTGFMHAWE